MWMSQMQWHTFCTHHWKQIYVGCVRNSTKNYYQFLRVIHVWKLITIHSVKKMVQCNLDLLSFEIRPENIHYHCKSWKRFCKKINNFLQYGFHKMGIILLIVIHFCSSIFLLLAFVHIASLGLSRSYGSWIYNYLCNQCLSPLVVSLIPVHGEVCQWLETGWWSSHGTPVSFTNETDLM